MNERVPVLSQMGEGFDVVIAPYLPSVDLIAVPSEGPVPRTIAGDILLTPGWAAPPNLEDVLERGVRWIHTLGIGVENFPLALLGDRVFTCSRGASSVPISEWVFAVILAFLKKLPDMFIVEPPSEPQFVPLGVLTGTTLGLVGFGGINREVARRGLAFGMDVVACRRRPEPSSVPGVEITDLDTVLRRADHAVLAAATTPATRHLLDARALTLVKRGVHIVNVGRGALVNQDALRVALDDGRVAFASLDTVDPEPLPAGHWMYDHPLVRISPHVSVMAPWGWKVACELFAANIERYRAGKPLEGIVDVVAGY
jgi:phosphoglycerate dehydrogenase-like enzyme